VNAVSKITEGEAAQVIPVSGATMMEVISRAAADPNTDVDKLERLLMMAERIQAQEAKGAFTAALAELQPRLPVIDERGGIKNNAGVVQSTYAKWDDINDAIRPLLAEAGFALSFRTGVAQDGKITVTGVLSHRAGHQEETTITLPHDSSGSKNAVQAVGSSTSYGKRYTTISLLNITSRAAQDRDDDGQAGGMGAAALHALTEINVCEGLDELRQWKAQKYDGLSKMLSPPELREVIALYNRRIKAAKEPANG